RGPRLLAPPQRERGAPAVRPHHPGTLSARIHLEARPGRDGAAARRRDAAVADADPLSRRIAVWQPLLPLLVGPGARRPRPRRRDRPELRRVLLSAGPEARPHVVARGRHRPGVPFPYRHRPPRRNHLGIPRRHRLLRSRVRTAPLDVGGDPESGDRAGGERPVPREPGAVLPDARERWSGAAPLTRPPRRR